MAKSIRDLSSKHFSRYGEFLVSFELTKYGWNVYSPLYDEYIDLIIHKFTCKSCNKLWKVTPDLKCSQCEKDFSKTQKNKIVARKICKKCGFTDIGNITKCKKCGEKLLNAPTCDECNGNVVMINYECDCGCIEYEDKLRTIQVKSSRIEKPKGVLKNSYAVDHKPKDMIASKNHFFIWCLVDDSDKHNFMVMSVQDFKDIMGESINGISFFKDQDRQHFSSKSFGKWHSCLNKFSRLE